MTENRTPRFFYGYIIVIVAFCIQLVGWGIYSAYGVFFNPLLAEFSWTRVTISGAASLWSLVLGLFSIITGRLGDKFGPRMVMTVCGLFFGLGYLLMSQISAIWHLYLFYGVIVAIGSSGLDVLLLSAVARWFVKKRGLMSGILKAGTGTGILIMPLVASLLISSYGWRTSYLIMGGVALVFIISLTQFLRRDPSQKGLVAYGAEEANTGNLNSVEGGFSLQEAIHLRQFWTLCAMCALISFSIQAIMVHIAPLGVELGLSMTGAASILSAIGGASIVGRVLMGSVGDRVGSRLAMTICFLIIGVALFWLQLASALWMLYLFAVVYGFAHGGFWAVLSPLVAELFGLSSHGVLFGIVYFSGTIGGALGPLLVGYIFDVTGSYQPGLLVCALLAVGSFILALLLRPTSGKGLQPGSDTRL